MTTLSLPLISISKHSSGELLGNSQITEDLQLNDLHLLNWDSESMMKKESTEVVGVRWMEKKTKKRNYLGDTFKFGSDNNNTPEENIAIPVTDAAAEVEEQLEQLASNIPTNISTSGVKPTIDYRITMPATTMASIAATTTIPAATILGRNTRFTIPSNPFGSGPPTGPPGGGGRHWPSGGTPLGGGPLLEEGKIPEDLEEGEILEEEN
jgi:hypothetical protein